MSLLLTALVVSLTEEEVNYAMGMTLEWLTNEFGGYRRAKELYNCTFLNYTMKTGQYIDPDFWGQSMGKEKSKQCAMALLTHVCDPEGRWTSLIPNSAVCSGDQVEEWYDRKHEEKRKRFRKKKRSPHKAVNQGAYRVCAREDVLPRKRNTYTTTGNLLLQTKNGDELSERKCSIISIGSNNHWGFEIGAFNRTDCEIHTFEPRILDNWMHMPIRPPPSIAGRTFSHW